MSATEDIRSALESQISNVVGVPTTDKRSWENVHFEPPEGETWIRGTVLWGRSRPSVVGPNPQLMYTGIFQVDVFIPRGTQSTPGGPNAADVLADAIRDAYDAGDVLTKNATRVHIEWSERLPGRPDNPWYMVPVIIRWRTHRQ